MSNYLSQLQTFIANHQPSVKLSYQVPLLGEGGSCSIFGELDPVPFDLREALSTEQQSLVSLAQSVVDWVEQKTKVEWFGVYLKTQVANEEWALTKLAYFGAASRGQFPLTESFAQISNNSSVGLSGQGKIINNVSQYVAEGGEYYTCDPKVKSELCWPILAADNRVLGIIDAESFSENCFDDESQALFHAVCRVLAENFDRLS